MATDDDWEVDETDLDDTQEEAEEEEWRFSLSDLEEDDEEQNEESGSAIGGNVFGSLDSDTETLEPGSPTTENTVFVIVGLLLASLLFFQFYLLLF